MQYFKKIAAAATLAIAASGLMVFTAPVSIKEAVAQACTENTIIERPANNMVFNRGQSWRNCRGYRFIFQGDGNLVVYNPSNNPLWHTGTMGQAARLIWQTDGNLVLYDAVNQPLWSSATQGQGARLIFQGDGNVVIYSSANRPLWATGTHNK